MHLNQQDLSEWRGIICHFHLGAPERDPSTIGSFFFPDPNEQITNYKQLESFPLGYNHISWLKEDTIRQIN